MFDDAHWAEVPAAADGLIRLARLDLYRAEKAPEEGAALSRQPPRCLDLCCGFGRIGLELARRGFSLTGVDITRPYLAAAREDAAAEGLPAEFIHADVRSFRRPGFFDLAVNLYNSFGYFEDPLEDLALLQNAWKSLKPGGVLVVETLGKELAARDFTRGEWFRRGGWYVFTEYEVLDSWGALKHTWRLVREDPAAPEVIEKTFVHRLYAAAELRDLFVRAGFTRIVIHGGWNEEPYGPEAAALILAGQRPLPGEDAGAPRP
jgi:SAM-dependent methyltransferase